MPKRGPRHCLNQSNGFLPKNSCMFLSQRILYYYFIYSYKIHSLCESLSIGSILQIVLCIFGMLDADF